MQGLLLEFKSAPSIDRDEYTQHLFPWKDKKGGRLNTPFTHIQIWNFLA